jgi:hypothetical protein
VARDAELLKEVREEVEAAWVGDEETVEKVINAQKWGFCYYRRCMSNG